jgi:hypothetical protein
MYIALVTLSLILVFGSSAFMSISGLLSIFTNNTVIIICMGLGMEIGKILTISHLYRSWHKNNTTTKTGYIVIVFVLTFLTSCEVLGFLSQSHQNSIRKNHIIQVQINALHYEESVVKKQIKIIDTTLGGLPKTHVTRRIQEKQKSGYNSKQERLFELIKQKADLEIQLIAGVDNLNPIAAIADVLRIKHSVIISIFIPLLVLILEPLTIGLTIAANSAWMHHSEGKKPIFNNNAKQAEDSTNKLKSLQKQCDLSVLQIAEITGHKKLTTCEGWLKGIIPTPPRALAEVKKWVENEYAQTTK